MAPTGEAMTAAQTMRTERRCYVPIQEHRRALVELARLRAELHRLGADGGSTYPEARTRTCGTCTAWDEGRLRCDERDERRQEWESCECWRKP